MLTMMARRTTPRSGAAWRASAILFRKPSRRRTWPRPSAWRRKWPRRPRRASRRATRGIAAATSGARPSSAPTDRCRASETRVLGTRGTRRLLGKSASRRARARPPTPSRRCGSGPRPPSRSTRPTTTLPIGARTRTAAGPSRRLLLHQARTGATGGAGMWAAAGGTRTRPSRLQGRARRPTKRIRQLNRRRRAARAAPRRTASTRDTW